tara:strand:- start:980 stop:1282 length:303 start_codon:yes stop_codon:yes gene_type:complete
MIHTGNGSALPIVRIVRPFMYEVCDRYGNIVCEFNHEDGPMDRLFFQVENDPDLFPLDEYTITLIDEDGGVIKRALCLPIRTNEEFKNNYDEHNIMHAVI